MSPLNRTNISSISSRGRKSSYVLEPFFGNFGYIQKLPLLATSGCTINGKNTTQTVSIIGNFCPTLIFAIYRQVRLLPV